jgi:hypothetical protein
VPITGRRHFRTDKLLASSYMWRLGLSTTEPKPGGSVAARGGGLLEITLLRGISTRRPDSSSMIR